MWNTQFFYAALPHGCNITLSKVLSLTIFVLNLVTIQHYTVYSDFTKHFQHIIYFTHTSACIPAQHGSTSLFYN